MRFKKGKKLTIVLMFLLFFPVLGGLNRLFHSLHEKPPPIKPEGLPTPEETVSGDLDGMLRNNEIRALSPYSKTFFYLDGADQRGLSYDLLKSFETYINQSQNRDVLKIKVIIIPTPRDRLIPGLLAGRGDIAIGNLTITPGRQRQVDFSDPFYTGISEILVTAPETTAIQALEDLCGKRIYVRRSSSYFESLQMLNRRFQKEKKEPVDIIKINEILEDEDILEMMNAGIISRTVIDSHKAMLWKNVFKNLTFHDRITFRENGEIAWAVRKNSPKLKARINAFIKTHQEGTLMGNLLKNRYLGNGQLEHNPLEKEAFSRFEGSLAHFKKYAKKYHFDWRMIAALAFQESRIDQSRRSPDGAVGVMQLLPGTAADACVGIADIHIAESNIHAGVKYLRFLRDRYFENQPMTPLNKMLFTLACYNAGPAKITALRKQAGRMNVDPNVWFGNIEIVAARRMGSETVTFVSNIYKYYIAYSLILDADKEKIRIKKKFAAGPKEQKTDITLWQDLLDLGLQWNDEWGLSPPVKSD
ncbi:MAG: lytic transglycosylase F [Desulfobacteraceae bacterium]|nr:MAG: lytic transglycosylase F [Desulfobacteraceae bacterium]